MNYFDSGFWIHLDWTEIFDLCGGELLKFSLLGPYFIRRFGFDSLDFIEYSY